MASAAADERRHLLQLQGHWENNVWTRSVILYFSFEKEKYGGIVLFIIV